jgi:hypothetical protein
MYWIPNKGNPILGSSVLPIIGENRYLRKWVNKAEGHKLIPMEHSKSLRLHLTENWALKKKKKIACLEQLMSHNLEISKNFKGYQNKDTQSLPNSWAIDRL